MPKTIHYRCPSCHEELTEHEQSLRDDNQHSFDIAKEGYVNLLLAQHMKSKKPGDSKEMLRSRRLFLEQGYYQQLADHLGETLSGLMTAENLNLLDIGCGEGYYLRKISTHTEIDGTPIIPWGIDIAKVGVAMAAKSLPNGHFSVASAYDLPFYDRSFGAAVSVFSPISYPEAHRVLEANGTLVTVGAAPDHLKEIAELIYDQRVEHQGQGNDPSEDFRIVRTERLTYEVPLRSQQDIANLVKMTPYYWQLRPETAAKLKGLEELTVTIDFEITVLQPII